MFFRTLTVIKSSYIIYQIKTGKNGEQIFPNKKCSKTYIATIKLYNIRLLVHLKQLILQLEYLQSLIIKTNLDHFMFYNKFLQYKVAWKVSHMLMILLFTYKWCNKCCWHPSKPFLLHKSTQELVHIVSKESTNMNQRFFIEPKCRSKYIIHMQSTEIMTTH